MSYTPKSESEQQFREKAMERAQDMLGDLATLIADLREGDVAEATRTIENLPGCQSALTRTFGEFREEYLAQRPGGGECEACSEPEVVEGTCIACDHDQRVGAA